MADTKTTALTANTDPIGTDLIYMVDDPGGSAASRKATMTTLQGLMANGLTPGGRLTLTTATPVTTADVTAAATVYYTPYVHPYISLYDGTTWRLFEFTEKSLNIAAFTASKPYDIFVYDNSGTVTLEGLVWTNATTRATALAYQDGRLVKSGATTRLYLGSIYVNSSGGQTDDSIEKRNVWNNYNRRPRPFYINEGTGHTYNSNTIRNWNNSALAVSYMCGVVEDAFPSLALWCYTGATNVSYPARVLLTLDASTSLDANMPYTINTNVNSLLAFGAENVSKYPTLGYHTINAMQQTIGGTADASYSQVKISGSILG